METIFALSTARGKAGVAVVRVSGPETKSVIQQLTGLTAVAPRKMVLCSITDPADQSVLDRGLVVFFQGPNSFTGEDVAEFHLHGSLATIDAVLSALHNLDGLRPAEAGEFTQRALYNDCLDLSQVEGLSDLINAETRAQQKQALRVFDGELSDKVAIWRENLLRSMALVEATIDFADEEIPDGLFDDAADVVANVIKKLNAELQGAHSASRLSTGFEVAIIGRPNVGKSTLLNALAGREAAIVSEYAGTTRDIVEVRMDVAGLPVTFLDTAGLRDSTDKVESIGIERAMDRANSADMRICLFEDSDDSWPKSVDQHAQDLIFVAKADTHNDKNGISGKTGDGVSRLLDLVKNHFQNETSESSSLIKQRHKSAVQAAVSDLKLAEKELRAEAVEAELVAENLRRAMHHLGSLIGSIGVEDILGEIFSSFCIGK